MTLVNDSPGEKSVPKTSGCERTGTQTLENDEFFAMFLSLKDVEMINPALYVALGFDLIIYGLALSFILVLGYLYACVFENLNECSNEANMQMSCVRDTSEGNQDPISSAMFICNGLHEEIAGGASQQYPAIQDDPIAEYTKRQSLQRLQTSLQKKTTYASGTASIVFKQDFEYPRWIKPTKPNATCTALDDDIFSSPISPELSSPKVDQVGAQNDVKERLIRLRNVAAKVRNAKIILRQNILAYKALEVIYPNTEDFQQTHSRSILYISCLLKNSKMIEALSSKALPTLDQEICQGDAILSHQVRCDRTDMMQHFAQSPDHWMMSHTNEAKSISKAALAGETSDLAHGLKQLALDNEYTLGQNPHILPIRLAFFEQMSIKALRRTLEEHLKNDAVWDPNQSISDLELLEWLLELGERCSKLAIRQAFILACQSGSVIALDRATIGVFLDQNAVADGREYCHGWGSSLRKAAFTNNYTVAEQQVFLGADVTRDSNTSLLSAASSNSVEIFELLLRHGAKMDEAKGSQGNILQTACWLGHHKMVTLILNKGFDINAREGLYGSGLALAVEGGHVELANFLISKGADVNISAISYANALYHAAAIRNFGLVANLIAAGANVNAKGGQYGTALQMAATKGDIAIASLLVESGADVNIIAGQYICALRAALSFEHDAVAKMLILHQADIFVVRGGQLKICTYGSVRLASRWGYNLHCWMAFAR